MKSLMHFINESVNPYTAVKKAFPKVSKDVQEIIAGWYDIEGAAEDFDNNNEFADFMQSDIQDMLDAADDNPDTNRVISELNDRGYM